MSKTIAMVAAIALILVCQANSIGTIEEKKGNTNLRKLGFDFDVDKTFYIKTFSFLGQKLTYKYRVAVKNGKAINEIIIDSALGSFKVGNSGVDTEGSNTWSGKIKIFTLKSGSYTLDIYAKGTLSYTVKYQNDSKNRLQLWLTGDLEASAEIVSLPDYSARVNCWGTLISASGLATITNSGISKGFNFSGTPVSALIDGDPAFEIFEDWLISF